MQVHLIGPFLLSDSVKLQILFQSSLVQLISPIHPSSYGVAKCEVFGSF